MNTKKRKVSKGFVRKALVAGCTLAAAGLCAAGTGGKDPIDKAARLLASKTASTANRVYDSRLEWSGVSYAELAGRHTRWLLSIPLGVSPYLDTAGTQCGVNQDGPVWFISSPAGTNTLNCTIPYGKALFGVVGGYISDYPCPKDFAFEPASGQSLGAFLSQDAAQYTDATTEHTAELDGRSLPVRRVNSGQFAFTAAGDLRWDPIQGDPGVNGNGLDPCITGSPQTGLVDAYYFLISSLSPGTHTLHIRAASTIFPVPANNLIFLNVVR